MSVRLHTIIVSRDMQGLLEPCLRALRAAWPWPFETGRDRITLVDNASAFPYATGHLDREGLDLLRFDTHQGFAEACNAGVAAGPAEHYLFLNNDVFLHPDAVASMLRHLEPEGVGICGARLVFPDGRIQHNGVCMSNSDRGPYHADRGKPSETVSRNSREFQAVTGACMLVRAAVMEQLGGFDTSYAFGLEDVDFCLRARQRGWRIVCAGEVDSLHFESMTEGRQELNIDSLAHFLQRWRGKYTVDG